VLTIAKKSLLSLLLDQFTVALGQDHLCPNRNLFQMGLECKDFYNIDAINTIIENTEKEFDLVLIVEYWAESLLLLKSLLNMQVEDVIHFRTNVAQRHRGLSSKNRSKLKSILWPEYELYDHFKATLMKKAYARRHILAKEELQYKRRLKRLEKSCGVKYQKGSNFHSLHPVLRNSSKECRSALSGNPGDVYKYMRVKYKL